MTTRGIPPVGALAALFGLAIGGGRALAQAPAPVVVEPSQVVYTAPPDCPSEADFLAAFAARAGQGAVAAPTAPARALTVELTARDGAYAARLSVVDHEGRAVERSLLAASCREAMEAIAVVAVVSLRSPSEAEASPAAGSAAPAPASSALPVAPTGPAPATATLARVPAPAAGSASSPPSTRVPGPRAARRARAEAAGRARSSGAALVVPAAAAGVGPGLAAGGGLRLELTWPRTALGLTTVTASFAAFDSGRVDTDVAEAVFSQFLGRVELCPWAHALGRASRVGACAGLEAGQARARAYADAVRVEEGWEAVEPWVAASGALRLSLGVEALRVVLGPELRVPFLRRDFVVEPHRSVYEVLPVAPGFGVGIGMGW